MNYVIPHEDNPDRYRFGLNSQILGQISSAANRQMAVPDSRVRSSRHGCEYDLEDDLPAGSGYIAHDLDIISKDCLNRVMITRKSKRLS